MTVARGIKCRLRTLSLFVTLSRQPTFTCMILETITSNIIMASETIMASVTYGKCNL